MLNKVAFGICCRCTNETTKSDITKLVKSIYSFHPNADIHVVDSSSPDKSYMEQLKGVTIHDIENRNYESGMIWHVYQNVIADTYVFLQDSCNITGSLSPFFNDDLRIIPWKKPDFKGESERGTVPGWSFCQERHRKKIQELIGRTKYKVINDFEIILCNVFLTQRKIMDSFYDKNLHLALADSKLGSEATERTFGMAFYQENIKDFSKRLFPYGLVRKTMRRRG